jgi:hypothetical protein
MMVDINDIGDGKNGYDNVIDFYKNNYKNADGSIKPIWRFVCSHPHKDHITGIKKLFYDSGITINNFWDTDQDFYPVDFINDPSEEDWKAYEEIRKGDKGQRIIKTKREDTPREFWDDDEDRITILSPSNELIKNANYYEDGTKKIGEDVEVNEMPYVLLINFNGKKVILGSDAQNRCWTDIYDNCPELLTNISILKASHHGTKSGFHEEAVKLMNPKYIVFSNSKTNDTANGAEESYNKACPEAIIYKTGDTGSLLVEIPFDGDPIFYKA